VRWLAGDNPTRFGLITGRCDMRYDNHREIHYFCLLFLLFIYYHIWKYAPEDIVVANLERLTLDRNLKQLSSLSLSSCSDSKSITVSNRLHRCFAVQPEHSPTSPLTFQNLIIVSSTILPLLSQSLSKIYNHAQDRYNAICQTSST
jgi:hypothetical protein